MPISIRNNTLKLFKHKIKDVATGMECRVHYWQSKRFKDITKNDSTLILGISISQKDYGYELLGMFPEAKNGTEIMTDYFEHSSVFIPETDPDYATIIAEYF